MLNKFIVVLVLAITSNVVHGYSAGAPPLTCDGMTPGHRDTAAQDNAESPYKLIVEKEAVEAGSSIKVTLDSEDKIKFKGFLIVGKDSENIITGTMGTYNDYSKPYTETICDEGGITHNVKWNNRPWYNLDFLWTAPTDFEGEVTFYATAVQNYTDYWVALPGTTTVMVSATVEENEAEVNGTETDDNQSDQMDLPVQTSNKTDDGNKMVESDGSSEKSESVSNEKQEQIKKTEAVVRPPNSGRTKINSNGSQMLHSSWFLIGVSVILKTIT